MSVPHAIKQQNEKGKDGLVSILVESQALPEGDFLGFMLRKFPMNRCMVTNASPFRTSEQPNTIPWACVIGVDGKLVLQGSPSAMPKKIDEAVDAELKKIKTGWGKSPEIKKARALIYGKNSLAEAEKVLAAAEQSIKDDARSDFEEAKAELQARYDARRNGVKKMLSEGRFADAQKAAGEFAKAVKGKAEWETEAAEIQKSLEQPDVDKEIKLDKELAKIVASIGEKAPTEAHVSSFKNFAKKNAGTRVGARAEDFAKAAAYKGR